MINLDYLGVPAMPTAVPKQSKEVYHGAITNALMIASSW
jgi:hypothetical protein